MIDDFDIDFNINEDDEEVDVYETSMEDLQYELYMVWDLWQLQGQRISWEL